MYRIGNIPATRYDREVVLTSLGTYDLSEIILWVGVDAHAVDALVNGSTCIEGPVRRRLQEMLANEEITISKDYAVTATVQVSCTVTDTVTADSETSAVELFHDRVNSGEVYGLFDDHTIDDISVDDIDVD